MLLDYDVFVNVPRLDSNDLAQRTRGGTAGRSGFQPAAGIGGDRRGTVVPQVTDGYTGAAPDLGALEYGLPVTQYGPRYVPHWL